MTTIKKRAFVGIMVPLAFFLVGCSDDAIDELIDSETIDTIALSPSEQQQISVSECGSMPVSDTPFSSSAAAPTTMLVETLVTGELDPDSVSNTENFWVIDLIPGRYTLVLENRTSDGRSTNIGTHINATTADQTDIRLIRANSIDHRIRHARYFEITRSTSMILRVAPGFGAEDYVFGVFANGSPVPSPFFRDCPEFTTMALASTEAFDISTVQESGAGEKWFEVDLQAGDYTLDLDAAFTDGGSTNLQLRASSYDQFGQVDRENQVVRLNEIASSFAASGSIAPGDSGKNWIRFVNPNPEMSVSTTLTQN